MNDGDRGRIREHLGIVGPGARRAGRRIARWLLGALLLIGSVGCDGGEAEEVDPSELPGGLVAISAAPEGVSNQAARYEIADGAVRPLWVTDEGANISDWRLSPAGDRVVYRVIQRAPGEPAVADEKLLVQALEAGAEPRLLASADTARSRLAGFVWSPDGSSLAYGKQTGGFPSTEAEGARRSPTWELRAVAATDEGRPSVDDRLLWQIEDERLRREISSLVAWTPGSDRAALLELAADSGSVLGLRQIDTASGEEAGRIALEGGMQTWVEATASPDGQHLLLAEADQQAGRVRLLELAGESEAEGLTLDEPGGQALHLLWDRAGDKAAWARVPLAGSGSGEDPREIGWLQVDAPTRTSSLAIEGGDAQPLAFSPDGRYLLVGEREDAFGTSWSRLVVHDLQGGGRATLDWTLPQDTWAVFWVD